MLTRAGERAPGPCRHIGALEDLPAFLSDPGPDGRRRVGFGLHGHPILGTPDAEQGSRQPSSFVHPGRVHRHLHGERTPVRDDLVGRARRILPELRHEYDLLRGVERDVRLLGRVDLRLLRNPADAEPSSPWQLGESSTGVFDLGGWGLYLGTPWALRQHGRFRPRRNRCRRSWRESPSRRSHGRGADRIGSLPVALSGSPKCDRRALSRPVLSERGLGRRWDMASISIQAS